MRKIVKQTRHGQITIPKEIRKLAGIPEGALIAVEFADNRVTIEPVETRPRRADWVKELYELFEPAREALKDVPEEEINEWIDESIKEVRARKR